MSGRQDPWSLWNLNGAQSIPGPDLGLSDSDANRSLDELLAMFGIDAASLSADNMSMDM
jgi:hypothetical protein